MSSTLSKLAEFDEFSTAMETGGGTRTYWRGLGKLVPSGKDELAGHPGALGGSRHEQLPRKQVKDSFKKGKRKLYKLTKTAEKFMAGSVSGPKTVTSRMKKVTSGFATPNVHVASKVKPIMGSANIMKTADQVAQEAFLSGFGKELQKEAQIGAALKGIVKGIAGAGKAGITAGRQAAKGVARIPGQRATAKKVMTGAKAGAKEFAKKLTPGQAAVLAGGAGALGGAAAL
jgi:hypothetical protein